MRLRNCLKRKILLGVLLLSVTLCAQEDYRIRSVEFEGHHPIPSSRLSLLLNTQAVGWLQRVVLGKDPVFFNSALLDADINRLRRYYQREGFLRVKVSADTRADHRRRTIAVTFRIDAGAPVLFGDIRFQLSGEAQRPHAEAVIERLRPRLRCRPGERFRDQEVRSDQDALLSGLNQAGYAHAQVTPALTVSDTVERADIRWEIDSGPPCRFGPASISGRRHVAESLIRSQLTLRPGQTYDPRLIETTQHRIFSLGLFQFVTVRASLNQAHSQEIPVEVQLNEAPRLTVKWGIGYGRDDRFRLFTDIRRLGFLGGARRLKLHLKHSGLEPYFADLQIIQPAFLMPRLTLTANPFLRRQTEPGFTVNRFGGNLAASYELFRYTNTYVTYSFERVSLDTASVTRTEAAEASFDNLYNKSSISLGISRDNAAPLFFPEKGFFTSLTLQYSGLGLRSKYHYLRSMAEIRHFQRLGPGWVLASRLKAGAIESFDREEFIPLEDRFYSGGSNSVRGWPRSRLGPRDPEGIPTGGNSLLEVSGELRYPILGIVSGVLFGDAGNVWMNSYTYRPAALRYSLGLGLRINTPIGPLRLDAAQPVADPNKTVQVHISVGQAF